MTTSIQLIPNKQIVFGKKLGEGGFGIVYKGSWQSEEVAIKTLRMTKLSSNLEEEFVREAQAMAKLNSPRIIRLFGICKEPGAYAIIMEFMPKGDLYQLLSEKKNALPWTTRWQLATDIGEGLVYLHANNILHRDLKSLNILLDHNLRAKITDFGLAALRQHTSSMYTESTKGSVAWMAPELFTRKTKLTPASDVYAYGMILWEIASRKIPFLDAPNQQIIPTWIKDGEREDIPEDCPKPYAKVITDCWKANPEERPTATKALESLNQNKPQALTPSLSTQSTSVKKSQILEVTAPQDTEKQEPGRLEYQKGMQAHIELKDQEALTHFEKAAEAGYPPAYVRLNQIYAASYFVKRDPQLAAKWKEKVGESISWFKKKRQEKQTDALACTGSVRSLGYKTIANGHKYEWFDDLFAAAKQGDTHAQYEAGWNLKNEYALMWCGVETDGVKAINYLRAAAAKGHVEAIGAIGDCYDKGIGVQKDRTKAWGCYKVSADKGYPHSQYEVAGHYELGIVVRKNLIQAEAYYKMAAKAQGHIGGMAASNLKEIKEKVENERWRKEKEKGGGCIVS